MAIVKILSRHNPSYASLIRYILQESKKPEVITHNLRSNGIDGYVKEFLENESFRKTSRSDQIYLFHEILSFNAQENSRLITPEVMNDIMREYVRLRGHDGVMLGAVHRDAEHVHAHFCVSALKLRTGASFGLSKSELLNLKISLQEYHREKYPELEHSFPEHGTGKKYDKGKWLSQRKEQRSMMKERVAKAVQQSFDRATSQQGFLELLRDQGLHHYERNGILTGIELDGLRVRFSRLLDGREIADLPEEKDQEQKVLDEIQSVREQRERYDRERFKELER